jgi:hypothetical protein
VAIGVTALYLVLAAAAHVVFFGFLPLIMSIRAVSRREKLAPAAVVAAVVALIVGIGFFVAR